MDFRRGTRALPANQVDDSGTEDFPEERYGAKDAGLQRGESESDVVWTNQVLLSLSNAQPASLHKCLKFPHPHFQSSELLDLGNDRRRFPPHPRENLCESEREKMHKRNPRERSGKLLLVCSERGKVWGECQEENSIRCEQPCEPPQNDLFVIKMLKHIVKDNEIVSGVIERESVIVQTADSERDRPRTLQRVGNLNASCVDVESGAHSPGVVHGTDPAAFSTACVEKTTTFKQSAPSAEKRNHIAPGDVIFIAPVSSGMVSYDRRIAHGCTFLM